MWPSTVSECSASAPKFTEKVEIISKKFPEFFITRILEMNENSLNGTKLFWSRIQFQVRIAVQQGTAAMLIDCFAIGHRWRTPCRSIRVRNGRLHSESDVCVCEIIIESLIMIKPLS
jgi:hypothetical protein